MQKGRAKCTGWAERFKATNSVVVVALKKANKETAKTRRRSSLAAGVLGDGLGALADSVLGKLTGKKKTDCSLNLPRSDGRLLVVVSQATGFGGDTLEDVVDERVHDGHGLAGDASVGVDLLQHLVDVDGVGLLSTMATLLLVSSIGWCFG